MIKTLMTLTFFFLLFSLNALAVQTIQNTQINNVNTLMEIVYPKFEYYDYNKEMTMHFHVQNSSGKSLPTNYVDCWIHIYDQSQHLVEKNLTRDDNNIDFEIELNKSIFTPGKYSYLVYCNNSEYGFVSENFEVTSNGEMKPIYESQLFLIIVFVISLALIIIGFIVEDITSISVGGALLSLLGGYIMLNGIGNTSNNISLGVGMVLTMIGAYFFLRPVYEWVESLLDNK